VVAGSGTAPPVDGGSGSTVIGVIVKFTSPASLNVSPVTNANGSFGSRPSPGSMPVIVEASSPGTEYAVEAENTAAVSNSSLKYAEEIRNSVSAPTAWTSTPANSGPLRSSYS